MKKGLRLLATANAGEVEAAKATNDWLLRSSEQWSTVLEQCGSRSWPEPCQTGPKHWGQLESINCFPVLSPEFGTKSESLVICLLLSVFLLFIGRATQLLIDVRVCLLRTLLFSLGLALSQTGLWRLQTEIVMIR